MEYPVIVEHKNGVYRALIPTLPNLSAEAGSYEEAIRKAQEAAQAYLSEVVVTSIDITATLERPSNQRSPRIWINSAGKFKGDEEAMQRHIEEIYDERRTQREESECADKTH